MKAEDAAYLASLEAELEVVVQRGNEARIEAVMAEIERVSHKGPEKAEKPKKSE